jgi:site-specific DNA-methyltransferase (adenine-specific)
MVSLYHNDCLEQMQLLPNGSIDCIITDPPYGTTACKWDSVIPFEPMWEQLKRVIKPNGAIVLFGSQPFTSALIMSNPKLFKYELSWDKKTGLGFLDSKFRPLKSHENIIIFGLGGCSNGSKIPMKYNPQGLIETTKQNKNTKSNILNSEPKKRENLGTTHANYPKSIHTFSRVSGNHPTEKPIELMEYLIKTYTNESETVLDFTMGSGSTGVACVNTNRNFIGIEKELKYYEIAKTRIEKALEAKTEKLF